MGEAGWVLGALNSTAFVLCAGYLLYVINILRTLVARRPTDPADSDPYDTHFVVPCLDEQEVVRATVEHLVQAFPRATVWCVDDASGDETPRILAELAAEHAKVNVITRSFPDARQGKGAALNAAWRAITATVHPAADRERVIVGVVDADGRLQRSALDAVCGPQCFGDPEVAAVQVQVRITEDVDALAGFSGDAHGTGALRRGDSLLVQLQDVEFVGPIAAMQTLRQRSGSVGMGGNGQFTRLSTLDDIALENGTPWHGALLEDFELGLHVLLAGRRTQYCDDTFVAQAGLTDWKRLLRQRSRWAQGGMQCSEYLWRVLASPKVSLASALEIAYYLFVPWSQMLGSIVFPLAIFLDCYYVFATAGGGSQWWVAGAWAVLPLGLLFGVLPQALWGPLYRMRLGGAVSGRRALALGLANVGYGYLLQAAVWWAFLRVLLGHEDWKKTARDPRAGSAVPETRGSATAAAPASAPSDPAPLEREPERLAVASGTSPLAAELVSAEPQESEAVAQLQTAAAVEVVEVVSVVEAEVTGVAVSPRVVEPLAVLPAQRVADERVVEGVVA